LWKVKQLEFLLSHRYLTHTAAFSGLKKIRPLSEPFFII
jgi:hypothetical protein